MARSVKMSYHLNQQLVGLSCDSTDLIKKSDPLKIYALSLHLINQFQHTLCYKDNIQILISTINTEIINISAGIMKNNERYH